MKPVLIALGVSGLAVLGAGAVQRNPTVSNSATNALAVQSGPAGPSAEDTSRDVAKLSAALGPDAALPAEPAKPAETAVAAPAPAGVAFAVGDRIKLAFYERLAVEEDKWGRTSSALRGIVQRPEMSGEYAVQDDGTVSVPMIGSVAAAGRSPQQLTAALAETFEQFLGHKGMVSIVALERAPIYVLGPVKNAGSYKYASGMTVLHAIAMAGGLDRGSNDSWSKIETVREIQKRSSAAGALLKLIARHAVLKAERDGTAPKVPLQLTEMVGATEAKILVDDQSARRKPIVTARNERQRAVLGAVEAARHELALYGKTDSLDRLVKIRQERVDSTRGLVERNVLAKASLSQVEGELSDAEQRRHEAINQYGMVKQRIASMEADSLKVQSDLKNEVAVEIEALERQIADNEREFNTSEGVLSSLTGTGTQFVTSRQSGGPSYQIVRRTPSGPVSIDASGMAVLQPGDLVNIAVGQSEAAAPQSPAAPDVKLPGGRSVNSREPGRTLAWE